jgi:hypothetical protein
LGSQSCIEDRIGDWMSMLARIRAAGGVVGLQVVDGHRQQLAGSQRQALAGIADTLHYRDGGGLILRRERVRGAVISSHPADLPRSPGRPSAIAYTKPLMS